MIKYSKVIYIVVITVNCEDKAKNLFMEGYNCAQSVVCAFSDITGLDEKTVLRISSSFGGGISRLREVCGAVSGMAMVAGYLYGYDSPDARVEKAEHYARIQNMANEFKDCFGSIVCREILELRQKGPSVPIPEERTPQYYKNRKCLDCIGKAAQITENLIKDMNKNKDN